MTEAQRNLRRLIGEGMYVVDPEAVAGAIVSRACVRSTVARTGFHSDVQAPPVRSFRRDPSARSFRLQRSAPLHRQRY